MFFQRPPEWPLWEVFFVRPMRYVYCGKSLLGDTGQAALGQSVAETSRAGVSLFPRVPRQGYQHERGVPHERVPQDSG